MSYPTFQEYDGEKYKYNGVLTRPGSTSLVGYTAVNDYSRSIFFEIQGEELVPWNIGEELDRKFSAGEIKK